MSEEEKKETVIKTETPKKEAPKKKEEKKKEEKPKGGKQDDRQARKAKAREEREAKQGQAKSGDNFGALPMNQSQSRINREYTSLSSITEDSQFVGKDVWIRARLHNARAQGKNLVFLILRQKFNTIQVVATKSEAIQNPMIKFMTGTTKESIVDIEGTITKAEKPVESTTQKHFEIQLKSFFVVSSATSQLPILVSDAEIPQPLIDEQNEKMKVISTKIESVKATLEATQDQQEKVKLEAQIVELNKEKGAAQKYVAVTQAQLLDNRVIDLRTTTNQAIFRVQAGVCRLFRQYLDIQGFTEIHTPKLISAASEGGADVFKVTYFQGNAYLAQSPQLYKQMAICGDLNRVYEIGHVFRAENSHTHRHLTEFIGLDLEMAFYEHYHEVMDVLDDMFISLFDGLKCQYSAELDAIRKQFPFEDLVYLKPKSLRLQYKDAIALLREAGETIGDLDDISTPQEKKLGGIVKAKYNTDFYILDKFPAVVRTFYTMNDPVDPNYTNAYDFFLRGEEILSGGQRIHDSGLLEQKAKAKGVAIESIQSYIDAFKYGAPPHGGGGIGLERVVMLYLGLPNIRRTSMFPRDPLRLTP